MTPSPTRTKESRSLLGRPAHAVRFALILLAALAGGQALAGKLDKEHQVKAAFILNFLKFIEWPDLGKSGSKFVVGVYGADAFEHTIEDTFANRSISGHPIVVEQIHSDAEIRNCRLVVSGASAPDRIEKLSRVAAESGTVLVGEADGFAKYGGTIGFILVSSRVRFEVNLEAARRQRVTISSKLSSLAQTVYR